VLHPQGDLDIAAVPHLEAEMRDVVDRLHPELLLVDLSGVSFLDCSIIGLLVRLHRCQSAHGGRLELRNAPASVRRLLAITGADAVLKVRMPPGERASFRGSPARRRVGSR